jgi:hypothetical protein
MVNAGRILIMPKGDWNALTTYDMLDLVAENGVAYLARQTNIGQNPSTDVSMTYWQPFGSASAIATTSAPGLVMPDGETISIDGTGLINVNIDNNTLVYDSVNHYLKANVSSALANLTDVNVTSAQNGQALIYDSTSQKWENTTVYGDGIALSSSDATKITSAIGTLNTNVGNLQSDMTTAQGDIDDLEAGNGVTTLSVDLTGWTSDTTSQSGTTLYKKQISVNNVHVPSPTISIGCGTGYSLPTVAEQESYNLLQYVIAEDTSPCYLMLFASAIPTTAYYINVVGVD